MRKLLVVLVLVIAGGCATQDPLQRAALGYKAAEQMNRATSAALNAKQIGSKDAQNVLTSTRAAAAGLDIGVDLAKAGQDPSGSKVDSSLAVLKALELYLQQKGAK